MTFKAFKELYPLAAYTDYVHATCTPAYVDPWE